MAEKLITVIVPVYNAQNTLWRCVHSIINQTFAEHIEIILVDDGSYDDSGLICDHLVLKYNFIHVIHQDNIGMGGVCNNALLHARGKYIAFVRPDDVIEADMYETLYKNAMQYDADMVTCGMHIIFDENQFEKTGIVHTLLWEGEILNHIVQGPQPFKLSQNKTLIMYNSPTGATLYRADFIKDFRLSTDRGTEYQDTLFSIKTLLAAKRISVVNRNLYCMNYDAPVTSGARNNENLMYVLDQIILAKEYLINQGCFEEYFSEFYKKIIIIICEHYGKIRDDLKPEFWSRLRVFFADIDLKKLPHVIKYFTEGEMRFLIDLIQK